jgi:hypothetical protein
MIKLYCAASPEELSRAGRIWIRRLRRLHQLKKFCPPDPRQEKLSRLIEKLSASILALASRYHHQLLLMHRWVPASL